MLEFLRKRAQSIVIQAIVVIIALVFIFWGVGTNLMNKQEAAIVVDNEEINFQQFQQAYDQAYARLAEQFGGTVPKGLADQLNIKQQVINQLVQESLLRQGGLEMGLMVSSREIQNEVESMVQFQKNGQFSMEQYQAVLGANRLSPEKYEQSLRYELLGTKTIANIAGFSQVAGDYEIEELYRLEKETVSVDYVVFTPQSYEDRVEVTAEGLEQWYGDNGGTFKTEKEIQVRFLPFLYSEIGGKISIGDDEVQRYYDDHLSDYQKPERRHARHILIKASPEDSEDLHQEKRAQAEEIRERAHSGEDFAALAQQYSEGPTAEAGGDLGFFPEGQMVQPFNDAVFGMELNQISDVVQTDFGYHVIKLEEIMAASTTPFDTVKEDIKTKLQREQAKPMALQMANEAYEAIIGAGSLDAYLDATPDAAIVQTDYFRQSAPPEGITADRAFLEKAFVLNENELSSIVEASDGYTIISAVSIKEPAVPALADVREQAEKRYREEQAAEQARTDAEKMIADLGAGGADFAELAGAVNLRLQNSGPLLKNDPEPQTSFPQTLTADAFRLSAAAPVSPTPGQSGPDFYVYKLKERKPPETALSEEDRVRYEELLLQFKQQRVLDAWLTNRQAKADITIHKSLENF